MSYKDPEKQKEYLRNHYLRNKEKYKNSHCNTRRARRDWFKSLKLGLKCDVCGEDHPACLDFHHEGDKVMGVSKMVNNASKVERILDEISKCRVLCSNCHRKEHYSPLYDELETSAD